MADNTLLNAATVTGGDSIRDLARQGGTVKTQAFQLDLGGPSANAEVLITAGQQAMSVSVPVVIAANQTAIPVMQALGTAVWAQSLAVTAGATATVVSIASSTAGYQIKGLIGHGTGDGYFVIQVGGVTVVSGRTRSTAPMLQLNLANGIAVATGSAVTLKVTNESGSTADYDATLLGN